MSGLGNIVLNCKLFVNLAWKMAEADEFLKILKFPKIMGEEKGNVV